MKRIVALLLLAFALLPVHVTAENEIDPKDCIPFPADCKKADVAMAALYAVDVPTPPKLRMEFKHGRFAFHGRRSFFALG